ncbi:Ycs4 condensin complex subunit [Candida orthopsilosis Co 90-125]|uniref:Condensin complex subunit 1 n=1 Tax=Candida orthopsilosis (strain 90-125) TaxID=1136231 RepID=H8X388_CANO9|nr:Ycs4 condensin complex subunit [Candida orthopsilosis Co 90-125]CCG25948.1 Ycs4 condensin complex subunit [Candida orthopsilosis Co 90-125]
MEFSLSSYVNNFDIDKSYGVEYSDVDSKLESLVESLAHNPESITSNGDLFDDLVELTHGFRTLHSKQQQQLSYLIVSSFNAVCQQFDRMMQEEDFHESLEQVKSTMERYGYLIFVLLKQLSKEDFSQLSATRSQKSLSKEFLGKWNSNCTEVENTLVVVKAVLNLNLGRIFVTTPERDAYVELFTRPIMNLMESPERMKVVGLRMVIFEDLCLAVTRHAHGPCIRHSITQSLTYYAHLPQYMAMLLNMLTDKYDYTFLSEEVLREIAQTNFNSNDTNGPKAIAEFLVKLSELNPVSILRQMTSISQLLANTNQTLRCSVVETCGNIVVSILKALDSPVEDQNEISIHNEQQVDKLLNLLEERFLDQNPFVRTKAFQALTKVSDLKIKLTTRRQKFMQLAVRSLDDRSTLVRRNAIKLIGKLIINHQFQGVHGTQLGLTFWKEKLDDAEKELFRYIPTSPQKVVVEEDDRTPSADEGEDSTSNKEVDEDISQKSASLLGNPNIANGAAISSEKSDEANDVENNSTELENTYPADQNLPDKTVLARIKLKFDFYKDAVDFIETIHSSVDVVSRLLFSRNRNEAIDAMDFLVLVDAYGIENSQSGIRKMLHLVWMKGSSDEGKSVASHLIDCYKSLFMSAPTGSNAEKAAYISGNLIELTVGASLADLASLEKLLCMMYEAKYINSDVIKVLWHVYNADVEEGQVVKEKRRGAIKILGMLALEDNKIAQQGFNSILNIGLGEKGHADLVLCRYTCIALQRVLSTAERNSATPKLSEEDLAMERLIGVLLKVCHDGEWFPTAEQAINTIFSISSDPVSVCSEVIRSKSKEVFAFPTGEKSNCHSLSQLLFIVGHVAISTIVFLEKLEAQFKKKKHAAESASNKNENSNEDAEDNELEMIGGTSEDDFADAVVHVKERELLYADNSLLKGFGSLVKKICFSPKQYKNTLLQRQAVLCLVKLMCVSSIYCEENLPLLLKIMEVSKDPVIRCNCVLGLGDLAVSFNRLIDENTDFIYRRLTDENIMVQRTCLMTVTFLILAGQVKVKGQLSSMAKCLENPDQGISDMCRLFFAELATKDNAIYNGFIDIFGGLSFDKSLSNAEFRRILKFLIGFVDKERHQKQLCEKLLVRLSKAKNQKEWNDVAFALETFPYTSEAITAAIKEGYQVVQAKE